MRDTPCVTIRGTSWRQAWLDSLDLPVDPERAMNPAWGTYEALVTEAHSAKALGQLKLALMLWIFSTCGHVYREQDDQSLP